MRQAPAMQFAENVVKIWGLLVIGEMSHNSDICSYGRVSTRYRNVKKCKDTTIINLHRLI